MMRDFTRALRDSVYEYYAEEGYPLALFGVNSLDKLTASFYDYPDVASQLPEYRRIIEDAYSLLESDSPPYTIAPSRPGQRSLDVVYHRFYDDYTAEQLEEMYQAIHQTTRIPQSWVDDVADDQDRTSHLASILARDELGFLIDDRAGDIAIIRDRISDPRRYLDRLVEMGIISYYPTESLTEALTDVIIGYWDRVPESFRSLLVEPKIEPINAVLVPLAIPPANPPLNLTRPSRVVNSQGRQLAINYLMSLPFPTVKELATSISLKPRRTKEESVTELIDRLTRLPYGSLPPQLKEVYDMINKPTSPTTVERLEELPTEQLRNLYISETGQTTPETRQEMVQAIREAESTKVTSAPSSSYATTITDPLQPWREALAYYPPEEVADSLGMVVPPGHEDKKYIEDNLAAYSPVIVDRADKLMTLDEIEQSPDIGEVLSHYTDRDLMEMLGIYPPYNSRKQLVDRLTESFHQPIFFMPLVPRCANGDREDAIAFGTVHEYDCFTPQELISHIRNGKIVIRGYTVPRDTVNELKELAKALPQYSAIYQAVRKL